ncbi:MAG: hypothetical protein PHV26_03050 [Candidatus Pacebacteria bacterium]|nr:hypothetical protein [Candidatus Paceibacterota bacterium]
MEKIGDIISKLKSKKLKRNNPAAFIFEDRKKRNDQFILRRFSKRSIGKKYEK